MRPIQLLKAIIGAGLVVGGLAAASVSALATTTTQQTGNLTLTLPVTMTFTGLAGQTATATGAAGTTAFFTNLTGASASTNSSTGLSISQQSAPGNAWTSGTNSIPASADSVGLVGACPTGATCTGGTLANNGTPAVLISTAAAGTVTFSVTNALAVPAAAAPGTYTNQIIFTATAT